MYRFSYLVTNKPWTREINPTKKIILYLKYKIVKKIIQFFISLKFILYDNDQLGLVIPTSQTRHSINYPN